MHSYVFSPVHDADGLSCRVESRWRCVRNSQLVGDSLDESEQICQQQSRLCHVGGVNAPVGSCNPVYNFLCCWATEIGDKWWHNDVIVEKVIKIDQNSRSQTTTESIWSVSIWSTESVGSHRELVVNSVHIADADATQLDSCVASASAVCIRLSLTMH